jgi:Fibronectin type III domain
MVLMAVDQRWVWGGIAVGGAGIALYMYRKNKKQEAQSAAVTAQGAQYAYGYAYGYGLLQQPQFDYAYGYGYGPYGLGAYGGGTGQYGYGYYGAGVPVGVVQQATTNAQWSQAAMSALSTAGYNPMTVLAALGQYLLGGNLTSDQAQIVTAAIAAEGYPPQSGATGFPPQMHTGGTPGGGQTGETKAGPISSLTATNATRTSFVAKWSAASNASQGYAYIVTQENGVQVKRGNTSQTTVTITGLHPGWEYNIGVQGLPGGQGKNAHVTLKK